MPTIVDYLKHYREPTPNWLTRPFDRKAFFKRTVFYPGSGIDGHPVEICNPAHAAHAYIYVDFSKEVDMDFIRNRVYNRTGVGFQGYTVLFEEELKQSDLVPNGWTQHLRKSELGDDPYCFSDIEPFGFYVVFQRDVDRNHLHGAPYFAVLFIGGDGIATYDALYCQGDATPPILAVIQDHVVTPFGAGRLLETLACRTSVFPDFLLVGFDTKPWHGYHDTGAEPDPGGRHDHLRKLFRRDNDESGLDIN